MAHNRISKKPIGINRMVKIIVSSRPIIPRYHRHNRFFMIPTAERNLIVVKLRNNENKTMGWVSKKYVISRTFNPNREYKFGARSMAMNII
ncbi:MAG: hypothetical protein GF311_22705 [Candidatus Lokiarchaeota archaeon]|nr:hypothetical protein [Candidatus Lokiarchaeota archaeon]